MLVTKRRNTVEAICDDNGIELIVNYDFEKMDGFYAEEDNPGTWIEPGVYTEIKSVELVIAGRSINILPLLHPNEKEFIISKLQYR